MAVRLLVDDSHPADADAGVALACPISPRCQSAARLGERYSLAAGTVLVHAHLAIGTTRTTIGLHQLSVPPPGGCAVICPSYERPGPPVRSEVPTMAAHLGFDGYHLDLVGTQRPTDGVTTRAVRLPSRVGIIRTLWLLHGTAWRRMPGPSAIWAAPSVGKLPARVRWDFGDERVTADKQRELVRCADLLLGRPSKPGRKSRIETGESIALALRAERMKAEHPGLSWEVIAGRLDVDTRTLRRYRRDLDADEHVFGAQLLIGRED